MAYSFGSDELVQQPGSDDSAPDPLSFVANIADVMLVFACGLMMALLSFWNLDLPTVTELDPAQMQELDEAEELMDAVNSQNAYIEKGTVYQDPNTGKLYWMIETDENGEPVQSDGASTGSDPSSSAPSRAQGAD
jgi:hypothetical protein